VRGLAIIVSRKIQYKRLTNTKILISTTKETQFIYQNNRQPTIKNSLIIDKLIPITQTQLYYKD
jgi:hypothetical protein